jgi:hypothetical protein
MVPVGLGRLDQGIVNFGFRGFCEVALSVATEVPKIRRLRDDRSPLPGQDTNVA